MATKNTVIVESNAYAKRNKYYWKAGNGTLEDLSESTASFFSKSKPQYEKFRKAAIAEIVDELIPEIVRYEGAGGLCIEVNGTEEDFFCIKNAVESQFPSRNIECRFDSQRLYSAKAAFLGIKDIYNKLQEIILEYSSEEEKLFFSDFMSESSHVTLFEKCKMADENLEVILKALKEKADRLSKAAAYSDLALTLYMYKEKKEYEESKKEKIADQSWFKGLIASCNVFCNILVCRYTKEFEREIRDKFMDSQGITRRVKTAREKCNGVTGTNGRLKFNKEIVQLIAADIEYIKKRIKQFWRGGEAEIKNIIYETIKARDEFTHQQKESLYQWVAAYQNPILLLVEKDNVQKKTNYETNKQAEKGYKAELERILKIGRHCSFERCYSELRKEIEELERTSRISARQKYVKERARVHAEAGKAIQQQKELQAGKREIEQMISFKEMR
ncbi:MAG: hypothetical protein NC124_20515 [Clostridium sp.]|nr:hypothetical protein [Acetatifactor muris]MCM1500848.1 hypothetical protein [Clostridium sp.]MCM1558713.1 hypothetical protein [Butyrivibrio sp.]